MSQHTSTKSHQSKNDASEEISEMPGEEGSAHPDLHPPGFAVSRRGTQVDLITVDNNQRNHNKSSFSKICRMLKQRSNSQTKAPLLGHGTRNRGRVLSLDSSDIFRTRSGNSNRRSSWYGGNIRTTASLRKSSKTRQSSNATRKCSKASVQTLDSEGLPVHCGVNFDVIVDVHRTASGTPVKPGVENVQPTKVRFARLDERKTNSVKSIDTVSDIRKSHQNLPEIVLDKTELFESDGTFCKWRLRSIDRVTRNCPGFSKYLGPVLIVISLCTVFVIALCVIVLFGWICAKVGAWLS